ncbi:MAG: outer membrane protein transport protein [Pseudomonadota bacterium]
MRLAPYATLLVLAPLVGSNVQAAGFYATELGARAIGRAGADVVHPKDGYAVWSNPAALANQKGVSFTTDAIGVQLNLEYQRTGPFSLSESTHDYGGYRVHNRPHAEIDPSDIGLEPGDDWQRVFTTGNNPSQATVTNKASPFVLNCSAVIGDGLDGHGHCPILDGILIIGERGHGVRGLTLSLAVYGPPTGGYWFWDESLAVDPGKPEAERYIDSKGFDRRFTGPQRYILIDRDVLEAFYQFTTAYKLGRYLAVGVGLQWVQSGLRMRTAVSADTYGTEDPNYDAVINIDASNLFLPSANIGLWSNPIAGLELGLSYQLMRPVTVRGPARVDYKAPGLSDFVIDDSNAQATIRFNMPAIARLGAMYRLDPWFDVEAALVWEQWSSWTHNSVDVADLLFSVPGLDAVPMPTVIQPKAYQDTLGLRVGGDVDPLGGFLPGLLTLRGGVLYETSAIPDSTLDVSLIDAEKWGISTGVELAYAGVHLRVAYQHRFLAERTVNDTVASVIAPLGDILGYETRTAAANGVYKASFDVGAVALTLDAMEMYDYFAEPRP